MHCMDMMLVFNKNKSSHHNFPHTKTKNRFYIYLFAGRGPTVNNINYWEFDTSKNKSSHYKSHINMENVLLGADVIIETLKKNMEKLFGIKWYQVKVSKSNKYEICQQKIINSLTNERHVLVDSYFCTHIFYLLNFDTNDVILLI